MPEDKHIPQSGKRRAVNSERATISMPKIVYDYAMERSRIEGFNSLSEYLASLVRSERKREEELSRQKD